jgi:hypothetical protein
VWYSNGVRTFNASSCLHASNTTVTCSSAPGVGANYSFVIEVDGVVSRPSTQGTNTGARVQLSMQRRVRVC